MIISIWQVRSLALPLLEQILEELIEIDHSIIGESWNRTHFELNLPEKWEHSYVAFDNDVVIGFIISSRKNDSIHIHRIAVRDLYRGRYVATQLLQSVALSAKEQGVPNITLKVSILNHSAIGFYRSLHFEVSEQVNGNLLLSNSVQKLLLE